MTPFTRSRRWTLWLASGLVTVIYMGCHPAKPVNLRGDGFEKDGAWGAEYRSSDKAEQSFGFSNKARDIEQSLGVK